MEDLTWLLLKHHRRVQNTAAITENKLLLEDSRPTSQAAKHITHTLASDDEREPELGRWLERERERENKIEKKNKALHRVKVVSHGAGTS